MSQKDDIYAELEHFIWSMPEIDRRKLIEKVVAIFEIEILLLDMTWQELGELDDLRWSAAQKKTYEKMIDYFNRFIHPEEIQGEVPEDEESSEDDLG